VLEVLALGLGRVAVTTMVSHSHDGRGGEEEAEEDSGLHFDEICKKK
jgi:hypothetical protein